MKTNLVGCKDIAKNCDSFESTENPVILGLQKGLVHHISYYFFTIDIVETVRYYKIKLIAYVTVLLDIAIKNKLNFDGHI